MYSSNFVFSILAYFPLSGRKEGLKNILQSVEPLICNDCEINKYTITVSRQQLGKHVPAATDTNATMLQ
jgi:hypothetical protein